MTTLLFSGNESSNFLQAVGFSRLVDETVAGKGAGRALRLQDPATVQCDTNRAD